MKRHMLLHFAALILSLLAVACNSHNITSILAGYPQFSIFNEYITQTKVADDVNTRTTITVLVVDNASMSRSQLLGLGLETIQHVLSLHVLLDYLDPVKLHSIVRGTMLSTTLFQTSGLAQEMSGFLNITDLEGGVVGFEVPGSNSVAAKFVKSIYSDPYNISVVQISNLIAPPGILTPSIPATSVNISAVLANTGHGVFARLITATGVLEAYQEIVDGGLTVFAPVDGAFDGVMTEIEKLSIAQQVSLLEFHARPVYSPLGTLKTTDGDDVTTLATNGADRYSLTVGVNGDTVILGTGVNSADITSTLLDNQPLVLFSIDNVLKPPEIFAVAAPPHTPSTAPASAPAPALGSSVLVSSAPSPVSSVPTPISSPSPPVSSPSQLDVSPPVSTPSQLDASPPVSTPSQLHASPPAPPVESPLSLSAPSIAPADGNAQPHISEKSSAFRLGIGSLVSILAAVGHMVFGEIFNSAVI